MRRPSVNARPSPLLVLGTFYFFNYGALGAFIPFLPIFLARRALSPAEISWIMVLIPFFSLLSPYLWGSLADVFHARVALLRLASMGCAGSLLVLLGRFRFWGNLLGIGLFSFFRAPLAPLADAATTAAMGARGAAFGQIRLWGSVGFVVLAILVGLLKGSLHSWLLISITASIYLLAGATTLALEAQPFGREPSVLRETWRWAASWPRVLFLAGTACYYAGHAIYDSQYSLLLRHLGFSEGFIGPAWAWGALVEIGVMRASRPLLERYRSLGLLVFCAVIASLRWAALTQAQQIPLLLGLQTLHGITFGLWYLSMVRHVQRAAPEHLRTSLQALTQTALSLGAVFGYLMGGAVAQRHGVPSAFLVAMGCGAGALVIYGLAWRSSDEQRV